MATFRKRGAVWRVEICIEGVRDSASFDTKSEGQKWADRRSVELREQQISIADKGAQVTLGELLESVKNSTTKLSRTRRSRQVEERRIDRLKKHPVCDKAVRLLTHADFISYKEDREGDGVAMSTVRRELAIVRAALNTLVETGQLTFNPVSRTLKALPKDRMVERLLSKAEIERLRVAHDDVNQRKSKNPWLFWAFLLAAETGVRKAELLGLRWTDIDLEKRILTIQRVDDLPDRAGRRFTQGTKNGDHQRVVPLTTAAVVILRSIPRAIDPVLRERVIPVSYNALSCAFKRLKRRAGIEDFRWHDLRHMATTYFVATLRNIAEVAVVTGHKDWDSLHRYTHIKAEAIALQLP